MTESYSPATKILSYVVPVMLAIILAGGLTYFLGLWGNRVPTVETKPTTNEVGAVAGTTATVKLLPVKLGLPFGYKGAPQSYSAKIEAINLKIDAANPNVSENLTTNLEARVYKFVKIQANSLDLSKGSSFDEAVLSKVVSKQLGSFELDVYPIFSKEFKGLTFSPNESKTLEVSFTPTDMGYYMVIIGETGYFESGNGARATAFVRVIEGTSTVKGATTKGGIIPAANEQAVATTSAEALPKTGGFEDSLLIVTIMATLGAVLKRRS